jgi:hypothetical protein
MVMRRAGGVLAALLAVLCVAGPAADAAGTAWHLMPVAQLGSRLGHVGGAAVNRSGTSVVVFSSTHSLSVARRTADGSRFKIVGRVSVRRPLVISLTALASGRFLLVYTTQRQLVARGIDAGGRFRGKPHVLAFGWTEPGSLLFPATPSLVVVDSDASRAVVVWGVTAGKTQKLEGAIVGRTGWSSSKVFYETQSDPQDLFRVLAASDYQDRFLVSLQKENEPTTARMWGVEGGSQQWERVIPPQVSDRSLSTAPGGATVASVSGLITAGWQDASAAFVVSTWNGSTWTTPVTAIAARHGRTGPDALYPVFVSDGSRAALVWSEPSPNFRGPLAATIRSSRGARWSAPRVFPHSYGPYWVPNAITLDTFWFTTAGTLAGFWTGDPISASTAAAGLYVGYVGAAGTSAKALSQTQNGTGQSWFALARADDLHTILWANKNGKQFSATVTQDGAVGPSQRLHLCNWPYSGASNPDASAQLLIGGAHLARNRLACSPVLLW